jgi:pimeloyl-ACP methyl ester carboxylesterase
VPDHVEVDDPIAGPGARGRVRCERRAAEVPGRPTVVLIGGMTQTLASWGGQIRPLAQTRPVLAYEARGQGGTDLSLRDVSLAVQADDLVRLLDVVGERDPVDVCGFSFGGRVALAFAAQHPDRIRRLVLSGVGCDRGVVGRCIVRGWIATLATGDLEALAWVSTADVAGPQWLAKNENLVESMVRAVVTRNRFEGIAALFRQTMAEGVDVGPTAWAERVRCPALVLGGAHDRLAPPAEVQALAERLGARFHVFEDAGHTIPIEAAQSWRERVQDFLDAPSPPPPETT